MPPNYDTGPPKRERGPGGGRGSSDLVSDVDQIISYPAAKNQVESQADPASIELDYDPISYVAWDDPAPLDRALP
jgi:hypothetical protein